MTDAQTKALDLAVELRKLGQQKRAAERRKARIEVVLEKTVTKALEQGMSWAQISLAAGESNRGNLFIWYKRRREAVDEPSRLHQFKT